VLQKEDTDWVKKCMEYEVEGPDQEVDPAMDRVRWKKLIKIE